MNMIRQNNRRGDFEGKPLSRLADRITKTVDVFDQQAAIAVEQIDREEVRTAWDENATIVGHIRQ